MGSPSAKQIEICWGERRITADLTRTVRRTLRIDVRPTGQVTVFAPVGEDLDEIRSVATSRVKPIFCLAGSIDCRSRNQKTLMCGLMVVVW
jgi:hypothetical protein